MQIKLTTTGRRTGRANQVTLYGWPDGDRMVIVGSRGGATSDPRWALNLRADPHASMRIGRETVRMVAREVSGDERDRLWKLVCEAFPLYATYQGRTQRRIPIFVLERLDESGTVGGP